MAILFNFLIFVHMYAWYTYKGLRMIFVYTCIHGIRIWMCLKGCRHGHATARVRGQPWVSVLTLHFVPGQGLLSVAQVCQVGRPSNLRDFSISTQCYRDASYCIWLCIGSGDLNGGPHFSEPSPQPFCFDFYKRMPLFLGNTGSDAHGEISWQLQLLLKSEKMYVE